MNYCKPLENISWSTTMLDIISGELCCVVIHSYKYMLFRPIAFCIVRRGKPHYPVRMVKAVSMTALS